MLIKQFCGSCPKGTLYESAYGASLGDIADDVAWLYNVTIVT